jgi:Na+-driven multidrug efflux pump
VSAATVVSVDTTRVSTVVDSVVAASLEQATATAAIAIAKNAFFILFLLFIIYLNIRIK